MAGPFDLADPNALYGGLFDSPQMRGQNAADVMGGMAQGLIAAGAPSPYPVGLLQGLGQGIAGGVGANQNTMQRAMQMGQLRNQMMQMQILPAALKMAQHGDKYEPFPGGPPGGMAPGGPQLPASGLSAGQAQTAMDESGGNPTAVNPQSGAFGKYQFTPDTAARVAIARPDLKLPFSLKTWTPEQQDAAKQALDQLNATDLQKAGQPVTPATVYLAHRFGSKGAEQFLTAPDDTQLSNLFPASWIKQNKDLQGVTVGQFKQSVDQRYAGQGGPRLAPTTPADVPMPVPPDNSDIAVLAAFPGTKGLAEIIAANRKMKYDSAVKMLEMSPSYQARLAATKALAEIGPAVQKQRELIPGKAAEAAAVKTAEIAPGVAKIQQEAGPAAEAAGQKARAEAEAKIAPGITKIQQEAGPAAEAARQKTRAEAEAKAAPGQEAFNTPEMKQFLGTLDPQTRTGINTLVAMGKVDEAAKEVQRIQGGVPWQYRDMHGDEFKAKLPPAERNIADMVLSGELPQSQLPSRMAQSGLDPSKVNMEAIVHQIDQKWSPAMGESAYKLRQAVFDQTKPEGKLRSNINVLYQHADQFQDLMRARDAGGMPAANHFLQVWNTQNGDNQFTDVEALQHFLATEMASAVKGGQVLNEKDIDAALENLSSTQSWKQAKNVLDIWMHAMGARKNDLDEKAATLHIPKETTESWYGPSAVAAKQHFDAVQKMPDAALKQLREGTVSTFKVGSGVQKWTMQNGHPVQVP